MYNISSGIGMALGVELCNGRESSPFMRDHKDIILGIAFLSL